MSGKVQGDLYGRDLTPTELVVALAMADHADHDGRSVRPSLDLVAWKVGMTRRGVNRIIARLRKRGVLVPERLGGGRGRVTLYRIIPSAVELRVRPETLTLVDINPDPSGINEPAPEAETLTLVAETLTPVVLNPDPGVNLTVLTVRTTPTHAGEVEEGERLEPLQVQLARTWAGLTGEPFNGSRRWLVPAVAEALKALELDGVEVTPAGLEQCWRAGIRHPGGWALVLRGFPPPVSVEVPRPDPVDCTHVWSEHVGGRVCVRCLLEQFDAYADQPPAAEEER